MAFELVDTIEETDRFENEFNFYEGALDNLWENDMLSGEHTEEEVADLWEGVV